MSEIEDPDDIIRDIDEEDEEACEQKFNDLLESVGASELLSLKFTILLLIWSLLLDVPMEHLTDQKPNEMLFKGHKKNWNQGMKKSKG